MGIKKFDGYILSIDGGDMQSAYSLLDENLKPILFDIQENNQLLETIALLINRYNKHKELHIAIEMIASYGMAVGQTVFETCVWVGRFVQLIKDIDPKIQVKFIYRKDEKMNLCHSMKAKDSNIRQALIDRFGDVGTKKHQGWFYGVKKDIWASIAVGVTYHDLYIAQNRKMEF